MLSPISYVRPVSFRGTEKGAQVQPKVDALPDLQASLQDIKEQAIANNPVAQKLSDKQTRSIRSLSIIGSGALIGPLTGMGLDKLSGAEGFLVKVARKISQKTTGVDKLLGRLGVADKVSSVYVPLRNKVIKPENLKLFKEGFYAAGGLEGAAKGMKQMALEAGNASKAAVAQRSLETLKNIETLGIMGRLVGKTGIFLKKNLTGSLGIMNGIFATMTVNSVINAKKGERVSTLMEDLLGTWIGSIGGYRLFENALKGLNQFVNPQTGQVTAQGLIPAIAKLVNKVPAKGFLFPLAGAMIMSSAFQKLSHKVFGKPTKEEPVVIDSMEDLQKWLKTTGWSAETIAAITEQAEQAAEAAAEAAQQA